MSTEIDYEGYNAESINILWHYAQDKPGYFLKISCKGVNEESPGDDEKSDEINEAIDILLNRVENEYLYSITITSKWVIQHFPDTNGILMDIWSPFSLC